eukprot:6183936-Pleurochrysis_carterae.AAC.3
MRQQQPESSGLLAFTCAAQCCSSAGASSGAAKIVFGDVDAGSNGGVDGTENEHRNASAGDDGSHPR